MANLQDSRTSIWESVGADLKPRTTTKEYLMLAPGITRTRQRVVDILQVCSILSFIFHLDLVSDHSGHLPPTFFYFD